MAFKSEAQRKKFDELLKAGKINQKLYDAMANSTPVEKEKTVFKSLSDLKKVSLKKRK